MIGKAPPFLLWLTRGDIDLPKSVFAVRRASLEEVFVDFAERPYNNGVNIACVESSQGRLEWRWVVTPGDAVTPTRLL